MFNEQELVLLSELVDGYLEADDLNQIEWADARVLLEKINQRIEMLEGALDTHDKYFRG